MFLSFFIKKKRKMNLQKTKTMNNEKNNLFFFYTPSLELVTHPFLRSKNKQSVQFHQLIFLCFSTNFFEFSKDVYFSKNKKERERNFFSLLQNYGSFRQKKINFSAFQLHKKMINVNKNKSN